MSAATGYEGAKGSGGARIQSTGKKGKQKIKLRNECYMIFIFRLFAAFTINFSCCFPCNRRQELTHKFLMKLNKLYHNKNVQFIHAPFFLSLLMVPVAVATGGVVVVWAPPSPSTLFFDFSSFSSAMLMISHSCFSFFLEVLYNCFTFSFLTAPRYVKKKFQLIFFFTSRWYWFFSCSFYNFENFNFYKLYRYSLAAFIKTRKLTLSDAFSCHKKVLFYCFKWTNFKLLFLKISTRTRISTTQSQHQETTKIL